MKKTLIVLMLVLLSVMLMVSCDDSSNTPEGTPDKVGNVIELGTKGGKKITWRVLAVEENCSLIISENILETKMFNSESATNTAYTDSTIRTYLNDEFISACGLSKESIQKVNINSGNIEETSKDENGSDYVFLLSATEAEKYFVSNADRVSKLNGNAQSWWLRSPHNNANYVRCVDASGSLIVSGETQVGNTVSSPIGVRPAFWYIWN